MLKYLGRMLACRGGLGIKDVAIWKEMTITKHIWFLISGGEVFVCGVNG